MPGSHAAGSFLCTLLRAWCTGNCGFYPYITQAMMGVCRGAQKRRSVAILSTHTANMSESGSEEVINDLSNVSAEMAAENLAKYFWQEPDKQPIPTACSLML